MSVSNVDSLLLTNAQLFGKTLADACAIGIREINRNIDYAIVDDIGNVQFAIGGIPLRISSPVGNVVADTISQVEAKGTRYAIFRSPIQDAAKKVVGWLAIPRDMTLERRTLRNSVWFNAALGLASWLTLAGLTANYFIRTDKGRRAHLISLEEALNQDESDTLEFKSSLRWDHNQKAVNRSLEQTIVKTVVAFLNTSGGVLLIGVDDDRTICGIQPDYDSLSKKSRDGFQLHLQQILSQAMGVDRYPSHTSVEFHTVQGKDVCLVRVKQAPKPIVIREQNQPILYVRAGGASRTLNVEEALRYVQDHWGGYI
jgi:hypothetical protein